MKKEYLIPTKIYHQILKRLKTSNENNPGRTNVGTEENAKGKKIYNRKVIIDDNGYDKGGAYWGKGKTIFVKYTVDKQYICFYEGAKEKKEITTPDVALSVFQKIIHKVKCGNEAQRGRDDIGSLKDAEGKKIYSRKIPLNKGYDKGGVYWGDGDPLYVDFTLDMEYVYFYRVHYGN